jgi:hypothetical protein
MSSTVGEEPVNDDTANGEEEDEKAPEKLWDGGTVGLENFD